MPGTKFELTAIDRSPPALLLKRMFEAAVAAADPSKLLAAHLPDKPRNRCVVVGAGKAVGAMAAAVEAAWPDVDLSGTVVVPYGYARPTRRIAVREAGHPVPDANGEAAAREILGLVNGLTPDDLVLALVSGGGSAAMPLPADGLTLTDKQSLNRALLASGLDIRTMNAVRRRLSAIKGGKLAAAAFPARVVTLGVSDIPGDDVAAIASGPTIPDPDASRDLSGIAAQLRAQIPPAVYDRLVAPPPPAPPPGVVDARLIATPRKALEAAAEIAGAAGIRAEILGDDLEGESRALARSMADGLRGADRPCVLLSGGETTVTLSGQPSGEGGRNTEFALALSIALDGAPGIWALAADTDGMDGTSKVAGALVTPDTIARAAARGIDARACLAAHGSANFFAGIGDLVVTGPTFTNVNDFRAILLMPA